MGIWGLIIALALFGITADAFWLGELGSMRKIVPMPSARYDLEDRLVQFGAGICRLAGSLPASPVGKTIAIQVIRSGTSPLANYGEVQGAESRRDFIHKLGICVKELRETRSWLKLIAELELCPEEERGTLLSECDELLAILASSVKTARRNRENRM